MKTDHTLTAARLRELMRYEDDGTLHWRQFQRGPVGSPAGRNGRPQVHVGGVARYVHRLIWLYHYGGWPIGQVDHINGDMHDNRIENLREATNSQNTQNVVRKSGGVSLDRRNGKWRARIMAEGRSVSLGYYPTEAEARAEYLRAKAIYHPFWVAGRSAA